MERPFTAEERDRVTILFGGFTWKHERLIEAVFRGCGYRFQMLPNPDVAAFQIGKEYGNNGQCNPTYFTVGNLIEFLRSLEARGLSRQEILDNYVFFTAGSCGPCRFGMYESEYRMALENAGFGGFRVLLFQQDHGVKAASGNPGLKFSVDLGMGALNALNLGDVINDMVYQIRPYEVAAGRNRSGNQGSRGSTQRFPGEPEALRNPRAHAGMDFTNAWRGTRNSKISSTRWARFWITSTARTSSKLCTSPVSV